MMCRWHRNRVVSIKVGPFVNYRSKEVRETERFQANCIYCPGLFTAQLRNGELRTQKLKSHLVRTQNLNFLPLKPRVGQYIAIHATLTARDFFLAYFYPSGPFTCIFSKTSPDFPVLAVANTWFLFRPAE